ncbi:UNVERIFIED_ORG: integrase [Rhizobium sophorae]|uniref:tyrosine-type recombinase/integrase n=1 Tax=Rhizobium leguminosarum TaxID=384 RepID=UPI00140FF1CB|nr:site-specific integrase [Rhizobium leguminosarum]MBB4524622.1 integrase [Rhizobium leguminosarum]MDH6661697.1 integrase [Rhizobium sophorae]QIO58866.1 tyrosine-type recombinase/integrase [Rhizobium leguminosarum bv. trifolii]
MTKLTTELLKNVRPGDGKDRLELRDDDEPGLLFRVTKSGARTWSIRYVNNAGEHRRKTIGPFPSVGLAKARELARKIKGEVASRVDIVGVEKEAKAEAQRKHMNRLDGLADAYFADAALGLHRATVKAKPKRASTLAEEKRVYEKLVKPQFGDIPVADIKRRDVADFVSKQTRRAKSAGRHCRNILRQLLSYAVHKELIDHNPANSIAVVNSEPRDRVLADEELRRIWQACKRPGEIENLTLSEDMGIALRMALVTLQRGGEVVGMRWTEIDREARTWTIPAARMKGKRAHLVPLSEPALSLLDEAEEMIGGKEFVFQSPRSDDDVSMDRRAFTRAMNRIVTALKIPRATPHDFRRSGATAITSERIGIPRFIVSQVIAHAADTGGAAAVTGMHYDLNDYLPDKRRALDAWANLLQEIVEGKERPGNVVPLVAQAG